MNNWFECKVSYEKEIEAGMPKKVSEAYLVDALSFTEAEARIIEEMKPFISGEFTIANIKRAKLAEIFFNDDPEADKYYRVKINYISLDEKSGAEKRTAANMLAQAKDFENALEVVQKGMASTLGEFEIASIVETMLMDVYPYSTDSKTE